MAQNYVTQTELGKLLGIDKQLVAYAIKTKKLKKTRDNKIDLADPLTVQYMIDAGEKTDDQRPLSQQKTAAEIKKLEQDHEIRDIKIDQMKKRLISKEQTAKVLFYYLDALNVNILESPGVMIDKLIDMVKSDSERTKIEDYIRDVLSREIKNTKDQVIKRLKDLE